MKKKSERLQITELFGAPAGSYERFFVGIIERTKDADGTPHLFSEIPVKEYIIMGCDGNEQELFRKMSEMALMVLDCGICDDIGVFTPYHDTKLYSN